jgi:hypothetical protein
MVKAAQVERLKASRVSVKDMVHIKIEMKKDITTFGAAGLTVGDG